MLKNLKIGLRLGFGFGLLGILLLVVGVVSLTRVGELDRGIDRVVNDRMPKVGWTSDWINSVNVIARVLRNEVLLSDPIQIEKEDERVLEEREIMDKEIDSLQGSIKTPEGIKILDGALEFRKDIRAMQDKIRDFAKANNDAAAIDLLFGDYRKLQNDYLKAVSELVDYQEKLAYSDGESSKALAEATSIIIQTVLIISVLLAIFLAWYITRSITKPVNECVSIAQKVAVGDTNLNINVDSNDEIGVLLKAMKQMVDAISQMGNDATMLVKAAVEGRLSTRADVSKHQGDYRKIVAGVNETLDAVIGPLNVAAKYVDDISKGNIPAKITDSYNGDFNAIKNNLNQCIQAVNALVDDSGMLVKAALEGRLSTRADASKHNGDFRKIVQGVNDTLDAVINPVNEAAAVLDKVAARDMTARMVGNYQGDLAKIKNSLNIAVDNLDKALSQVTDATGQVASASQQISAGSQSLAQGANEQASSLEEVSSSLEEMASMTKQNADNAIQAKSLSSEANDSAKVGSEAMNRMSGAINRIKESSDQTAKIVKTIDEIAMQTNLLALNAAVEAARAGEAGRGFAVVAEEVRNLAQRSAQAAKNTADMIGESVKNADDGVKIAVEVSKSFEMIAVGAKKVNDLIGEIAAASKEQSTGIEQVTTAVSQMDKVTQQNAANSEESASAAEELSSQAEELQAMVGQFRISLVAQNRPASIIHQKRASGGTLPPPKSTATKFAKRSVSAEEIIPLDDDTLKEF